MRNIKLYLFLLLGAFICSQVKGQSNIVEKQSKTIELDTAVRFGILKNGFTYYLLKNEHPANMIHFELVVKAGAMQEDMEQSEYAHLLEHLVQGSTINFPDVSQFLKEIGGHSNAHTNSRSARYYVEIPSHNKQVLNRVVDLIRDWADASNEWRSETIKVEREAVIGEARSASSYMDRRNNFVKSEVLNNHGYEVFNQDQNRESLKEFKPDALQRFYRDWYRPELEAVIVVGDIDLDSLKDAIEQKFSDLKSIAKSNDFQSKKRDDSIRLNGKNYFATISDSLSNELVLSLIHVSPEFDRNPKNILDFQNTLVQELFQIIIKSKSLQLSQQFEPPFEHFSANYGMKLPDGQLNAYKMSVVLPLKDQMKQQITFQRALTAWRQMQMGINASDLESAKNELMAFYEPENGNNSSDLVEELRRHFVFGRAALTSKSQKKLIQDLMSKINLADIKNYSENHGDISKNTSFIFFKSAGASVPSTELLEKWIKEVDNMFVEPLPEKTTITSLANLVSIPISKESAPRSLKKNVIGVTTIELTNGLKLLLKPTLPGKDAFKDKVSLHAYRPIRFPISNSLEYLAAMMAPEVIEQMGAGPYDKFELERFMTKEDIHLRFGSTMNNQFIHADAKSEQLPELFSLFMLYLKHPRKDKKGFEAWKNEKRKELEGLTIRGTTDFITKKINATWYPQLPVMKLEYLKDIQMKHFMNAWNSWYSSLNDYTIIVTGDFEEETLTPILVNTLSAFPINQKEPVSNSHKLSFPLKKMNERLGIKNIDQAYTDLYFPVRVPNDLKTRIELELLSSALHDNVYERLREGCYAPRASGEWMDFEKGIFAFHIHFDSELGNEEKMKQMALKAFRELKENGVQKKWLKTTIENEVRAFEGRFERFGYFNFWPEYLQSSLENGEDPVRGILNYGTLMEHFIKVNDVNNAAFKYMLEDNLQEFKGYPENYRTNDG